MMLHILSNIWWGQGSYINDVTRFRPLLISHLQRHAFYYLGLNYVVKKSLTPTSVPTKIVTSFVDGPHVRLNNKYVDACNKNGFDHKYIIRYCCSISDQNNWHLPSGFPLVLF